MYIDKHVVQIYTENNINKDLHGTKDMVVKAANEYRVVCAKTKNPVMFRLYNSGKSFAGLIKPYIEKVKSLTGKAVELLGVDKGAYNFKKISAACDDGSTIAIWGKDTVTIKEGLEKIPQEKFETYKTEMLIDDGGTKKEKVLSHIADAGEMVVDKNGNKTRVIAIENADTKRRVGILVFGQNSLKYDKRKIADFLYGKQDIENNFKERKRWGSDCFCGGKFIKLPLEKISGKELEKAKKRLIKVNKELLKSNEKENSYLELMNNGKIKKSEYNSLMRDLNRKRKRWTKEVVSLNEKISYAENGKIPEGKEKMKVDLRKMAILSQIQDHVIACRKYIMDLFKKHLRHVMISRISENTSEDNRQFLTEKIDKTISNLNMRKLGAKLFDQGGYIYKDEAKKEFVAIMNDYPNEIMQEAYRLLCEDLNKTKASYECDTGMYTMVFILKEDFEKLHDVTVKPKVSKRAV